MNIFSLKRDATWVDIQATEIAWSTDNAIDDTPLINADATIYDSQASVKADKGTMPAITTGWRGLGLYLKAPILEYTPYRVKAFYNTASQIHYLGIGYGPASPTGSDDTITPIATFPLQAVYCDDVFMVPALDSAHADFGKPLAFCLLCSYTTGGASAMAHLSVQRLATQPPQFAQATA